MVSLQITKAATLGFLALLPLTLATNSASGQAISLGSPRGPFQVAPETTKSIVDLSKPGIYRVCASSDNGGSMTLHFDAGSPETLHAGECRNFKAERIEVENAAKSGFARGTFVRRAI
jgi:hypothetical protein